MRLALIACVGLQWFAVSGIAQVQAPHWTPTRTVEIISSTGVGGAQDRVARNIQAIVQNGKLSPLPMIVVNKPGGSGAVSVAYLNRTIGDGHSLLVASALMLSSHIMGRASFNYTDMSPIAQLFHEYAVLVVRNESPIKNGGDFIGMLKSAPDSISIGVTVLGTAHHISIARAAKAAGIDPKRLKMVTFKSGTDAMVATMGGHVDATVSSASNILSGVESGTLRALAISAPQRLSGRMAKVATWRELGLDSVSTNFRMIFGPRGMSNVQVAYWDQIFSKVVASDTWAKEMEANAWVGGYLDSKKAKQVLAEEYGALKIALSELGMAKQ